MTALSDRDTQAVFADAAPHYLTLRWSPIPLDTGTKGPPPAGWTGYLGRRPGEHQVKQWARETPGANVALRLHPDVVGVDVDAYHGGLKGLAELEANYGPLPPTWASTSRSDGSGIRLLRVPMGWQLRTDPAQGVDMIQAHHRYVVAAPSIHPEGRPYRWIDLASGEVMDTLEVEPGDLPELPWGWLNGLKADGGGKLAERAATPDEVREFMQANQGHRSMAGLKGIRTFLDNLNGTSRHDHLVTAACWAMREAAAGKYPAAHAISALEQWWQNVMDNDEKRRDGGELGSAIAWAIAEAKADPARLAEIREKAVPSRPTLTDLGNARRLVEAFGEDLRHVPQLGQWIRWEGTRWEEDVTGQVMRHAKSVAEAIINEAQGADDDRRKAIGKHWLTSQNAARLRAMVDLASTEQSIPVRIEELDSDPWMLNTATGVVDLRTGDCRPARREDLMTKRAGTYDPDAKAPKWRGFLAEIFDGDDELTGLMQRSAGIALTGDVSEQFLWFLHGGGANGKSTYINQQRRTLGDYSIQLDPRLLMASDHQEHPTGLTDLRGVRFAATVEVEQGRRLAEVLVKQLTGGDPIRARRMHKDNFEFLPTHKIWMAANHLPQITGTDHAIWRRILLIPFTQTFTGDRVDRDLPGKLAAETPGVLAWAVEGCLDWQSNGLQIPDRVRAATDAYRANEDHVGRFLLDCFTPDANDFVTAARLRETYEQWCSINGEKPWTARSLGRELTSRGYDSVKQGGAKRWLGLRSADGLDLSGVA